MLFKTRQKRVPGTRSRVSITSFDPWAMDRDGDGALASSIGADKSMLFQHWLEPAFGKTEDDGETK